jgi:hypothetical protein
MTQLVTAHNPMLSRPRDLGGWTTGSVAGSAELAREINWQVAMIGDLHVFRLSTIATSIAVVLSVLV